MIRNSFSAFVLASALMLGAGAADALAQVGAGASGARAQVGAVESPTQVAADFDKALELYDNGMYGSARTIFEDIDTPLSSDYAVLCAIKLRTQDCGRLVEAVDGAHPKTILNSEIHNEYAKLMYLEGNYQKASDEFALVDPKALSKKARSEYWFKRGFCNYNMEVLDVAENCFRESLVYGSEYDGANAFGIASIYYRRKDFVSAAEWFELSKEEPQFSGLSEFYLVDCHFMMKDYAYVVDNGEKLLQDVPQERQEHLSRLLSEAFLVQGNAVKAREYLGKEDIRSLSSSDDDCFHAASVLYASGDWSGAVKYFSMMKDRSGAKGQIASYQMGSCYLNLKNKVAAMNSFKKASELKFDENITEDAFFNYAKLTFDLNGDDAAFHNYIAKYGTSKKGSMIYNYLAMSALTRRDYAAAVDAYGKIEDDVLDPAQQSNYMKANFLRADQLLRNGSYSAAIPFLKTACALSSSSKIDPFYQLSRYLLAETYYHIESYKDANKAYTELYNLSALRGRKEGQLIPYNLAYCYYNSGDWDKAAKWFDTYIKSGNQLAREDALTRRADCDFLRKDYKAAAASYKKLISEYDSSENIYPHYHLGMAYALTEDKQNRADALRMVMDAPSDARYYDEALYEYGRASADINRVDDALDAFDRLYSTSSNAIYRIKAMLGMGMVYRNAGQSQEALRCYKVVVSEMPDSEFSKDALLSIQSIYTTSMGEPQKYLDYLSENNISTGNTTETRQLYYSTAEQLYLLGKYDAAISSFMDYLKRYPEGQYTADAHYYLAASYKAIGMREKAREYYRLALSEGLSGSSYDFAINSYAALSFDIENYEEAYAAYCRICSEPNAYSRGVDPFLGMMRSAYKGRKYDETIAAGKTVLTMTSDPKLVREVQYDQAKSYMSTSRRDEAFVLWRILSTSPATAEGAEASVIVIQDLFDRGQFSEVENMVYGFGEKCGDQSYWLARAYIILADSFAERGNVEQAVVTLQSIRDGYSPEKEDDDILDLVNTKLLAL